MYLSFTNWQKIFFIIILLLSNSVSAQLGVLDSTFNPLQNGFGRQKGMEHSVKSIVYLPDGKLLVGGWFDSFDGKKINQLTRLNIDGTIDSTFNVNGTGPTGGIPYNYINKVVQLDNGKFLIAGFFESYNNSPIKNFARINKDGSLDATFNLNGLGLNGSLKVILPLSDGKILIGGNIVQYNGVKGSSILRLLPDGTIDNTFNSGQSGTTGGDVYSISEQVDGKLIIAGYFSAYNGKPTNRVLRLNQDGTIDESFNFILAIENTIYSSVIQKDGKIILAGKFHDFPNIGDNSGILRVNNDGSLDSSFKTIRFDHNYFYFEKALLQSDDKILIGGLFDWTEGKTYSSIARLNSDGTIDTTFNVGIKKGLNYTFDIFVQANGHILFGGNFNSYGGFDGIDRDLIARVYGDSPTSCNLKLTFNNIRELDCENNIATATAKAYFGFEKFPFKYKWLNATTINDSVAIFDKPGVYYCTVNNHRRCVDTANIFISEPKFKNTFDLSTQLVGADFRTGFESSISVSAQNLSCIKQSGQLKLVLDSLLDFQNAQPAPDYIFGDTLVWNFLELDNNNRTFSAKVKVRTSLEAQMNDTLELTSLVTLIKGDIDSLNNKKNYFILLFEIGGYDAPKSHWLWGFHIATRRGERGLLLGMPLALK